MPCESATELFRHTLSTVAYRGGKALLGAPDNFSDFRIGRAGRTAGEILAHVCDVLDWGLIMAKDKHVWHESAPQAGIRMSSGSSPSCVNSTIFLPVALRSKLRSISSSKDPSLMC
jgi:hypothetical protein